MMLRVDAPWMAPSSNAARPVRMAPATIVSFRSSGEYAELHCWLIEQPDETLYIASRTPRVAAIGTWKQSWSKVAVKRASIARTVPLNVAVDPLCTDAPVLVVDENGVNGNIGATSIGLYMPVTRLVAPDFESYVSAARNSSLSCEPKK